MLMEEGQRTPIWVRLDGRRFVLVEGLHRLEACKALGEETMVDLLVQAPGLNRGQPPKAPSPQRVENGRWRQGSGVHGGGIRRGAASFHRPRASQPSVS